MPLSLLVPLVVGGIALVVIAVHLAGWSRRAEMKSAEAAIAEFLALFPEENVQRTMLTSDGSAAFLRLSAPDRLGFVESFGDRFIVRVLEQGAISSATLDLDKSLAVRFADFTHPSGRYSFADQRDAEMVAALLGELMTADRRAGGVATDRNAAHASRR